MSTRKELRRHTRRPIDCDISVSWQEDQGAVKRIEARGLDLSDSGARMETLEPIAPNSYIHVRLDKYAFGGTAVVRHCARRGPKYVIGLELCETSRRQSGAGDPFVDYYELLQISPSAETETIHRVFKILVARYHPDNVHTGNVEKFLELTRAYDVLSDPDRRTAYDAEYHLRQTQPIAVFELKEFLGGVNAESNRRLGILVLLYNRRRVNPEKPGISLLEFERLMSFPREHLLFTVWFLKEKGYIHMESNGDFAISAAGAEFVESNIPSHRILHKLLRASEDEMPDEEPSASAEPAFPVTTRNDGAAVTQ